MNETATSKRILWADDEIALLKPHVLFLRARGYDVTTVTSGDEAVDLVRESRFDAVLLDEMMPGRDGLSTLEGIKEFDESIPVIMITKSEEEELVDTAIRKRINDYLLKPVNPVQILSALRRVLDRDKIEQNQVTQDYLAEFNRIRAAAHMADWREWIDIHKTLSRWDIEFERFRDIGLKQTHADVHKEMNAEFSRFVQKNYKGWVQDGDGPHMSPDLFREYVIPSLRKNEKVYFIVIDCMRLDHWYALETLLEPYFHTRTDYYYSILPTATPYSRNAIFAGLYPDDIAKKHPQWWKEGTNDEKSLNRNENELMNAQLKREHVELPRQPKYIKIYNADEANMHRKQVSSLFSIPLVAMVFNFVDIFAHGRSDSEILQELAPDEAAFRSVMESWFKHSALFEILRAISSQDAKVFITTDHGSVICRKSATVYGNKQASTNLRYKYGVNLNCEDAKQVVKVDDPADYRLPADGLGKNYIFAKESYYFVYPTNFHEYERQFRNTFQHGGISMEEMILPIATLTPKRS